jgi:HEPN domain-containing protein
MGMDITDTVVDICAYHCQQCIEKVAKYVILLEGKTYASDHRSDEYLLDLDNVQVKTLVEEVSGRIDTWATTIRYSKTLMSNKNTVEVILNTCEKLVKIAEELSPKEISNPLKPSNIFQK